MGRKSCWKRLGFDRGGTTLNEEDEEEEARKAVVARLHTVDRTGDQEAPLSMRALTSNVTQAVFVFVPWYIVLCVSL